MSRKQILTQNAKMKTTMQQNPEYVFYNVSMPAGTTCPFKGKCVQGCYARSGRQAMPNTVRAYQENLDMYNEGSFFPQLSEELDGAIVKALIHGRNVKVRLHDSGDFFSYRYLRDWLGFMEFYPSVQFYAYTKSIPFMERAKKEGLIPRNFTYVYSYGGACDMMIDPLNDRHAVVITSNVIPSGYTDGSHDDVFASMPDVKRIALTFHGQGARFEAGPQ